MTNKYPNEFNKIMEEVFQQEGGFVYNEDDPGGATNMGITIHTMRKLSMDLDGDNDVDVDDVGLLTKKDAKEVYWRNYWLSNGISKYPKRLRLILFDMTVNFGRYGAIKVLQRAVNNKLGYKKLKVDGITGNNTISQSIKSNIEIERIKAFRVYRYCRIVEDNKDLEKFLYGWIRRANRIG